MRKILLALVVTSMTVSACGAVRDSRINPFNWFGKSRAAAMPAENANPLIPQRRGSILGNRETPYQGVRIGQITDVKVERVGDGAIIRVHGVAQRVDAYNLKLIARETKTPSVVEFELLAEFPAGSQTVAGTRPVVAARHLSTQDLEGVRIIRVLGGTNAREVRR